MKKPKDITYQAAVDQGTVKKDDYFLVKYPDGRDVLFRLDKTCTEDYVMLGPPTEGRIRLEGKEGYDNIFTLADKQVKKEYSHEGVFEEVHACGLPQKEYKVNSYKELYSLLAEMTKMYKHSDDARMHYALVSCCMHLGSKSTWFYGFFVNNGRVGAYGLYGLNGETRNCMYEVRPEAIPKPTMMLLVEGRDGSKANPWICLNT